VLQAGRLAFSQWMAIPRLSPNGLAADRLGITHVSESHILGIISAWSITDHQGRGGKMTVHGVLSATLLD